MAPAIDRPESLQDLLTPYHGTGSRIEQMALMPQSSNHV